MAEVFADVRAAGSGRWTSARRWRAAQAVADCVAAFGRLDVLANVAGFHQMRHTATMTDDEWEPISRSTSTARST